MAGTGINNPGNKQGMVSRAELLCDLQFKQARQSFRTETPVLPVSHSRSENFFWGTGPLNRPSMAFWEISSTCRANTGFFFQKFMGKAVGVDRHHDQGGS